MINEEVVSIRSSSAWKPCYDRMDAIGKGILGITIPMRAVPNHKFDPLKQEDYYRMFAFINSANDSNIAVYTPQEQMKREEIFRKTRKSKRRSAPSIPRGRRTWPGGRTSEQGAADGL